MDREVKAIAYASAASAPSDRARRTASGARSSPSTSAASDDDLASHVRSAGGHGNVVFLAFPARAAVEGNLLRHPVDALQDREGVSDQGHPADAVPDLALLDSESGLGDGLERSADGILHPADPLPCQDAGLRVLHDLVLLVAARAEVRVRHAHPDPTAEVLRAAVAGRTGLQHAGRLEAVQEAAVDPAVDDRRLVGRRPFRIERDGAVRPRIGAVVVHRDERRSDFLTDLSVRKERFLTISSPSEAWPITSCARRPETPGSVTTVISPAGGFAALSISTASRAMPRPNSARSSAFTSSHPVVPSRKSDAASRRSPSPATA